MKNSGSRKISERYVSAVFDVAVADNNVSSVEKDLLTIAELIKENSDFQDFLHNPLLTREAQGKIAMVLMQKIGVSELTARFIALLAHHKRLNLLPEMITIFLEKSANVRGELSAELVVAQKISEKESASVAQSLSKAVGKKINLSVREDPAILGGTIINVGSLQLDGSLAGKLNRLQQELKVA
ncbi:MAG: ATP synthase F1 subunit delta [Pseudomonadota bacterium]